MTLSLGYGALKDLVLWKYTIHNLQSQTFVWQNQTDCKTFIRKNVVLQIATSVACLVFSSAHFKLLIEGSEGGGGGLPIPFPSSFFFQIPLRNSQIPFPFLSFNIFFPFPVAKSQFLCYLNPTLPGQNLPIPIPILPLQGPLNKNQAHFTNLWLFLVI